MSISLHSVASSLTGFQSATLKAKRNDEKYEMHSHPSCLAEEPSASTLPTLADSTYRTGNDSVQD
jgi:hypothetical protein